MNNDNYNDIDYEEFREKKHGPVFNTLKWLCLGAVFILCLLLFFRIVLNNTVPKDARRILWDEEGFAAYTEDPEGFELVSHPINSYVTVDGEQVVRNNMTGDAYFSFSDVCYSTTVDQLQLTVRYNVSTLDRVRDDLELSALPEGEPFVYTLADEDGNVYGEYVFTTAEKSFLGRPRYEYRRLLFTDIRMAEIEELTLRFYPMGRTDEEPIDEIIVYDKEYEKAEGVERMDIDTPEAADSFEG